MFFVKFQHAARMLVGDLPFVAVVERERLELVFYLSWYNLPSLQEHKQIEDHMPSHQNGGAAIRNGRSCLCHFTPQEAPRPLSSEYKEEAS